MVFSIEDILKSNTAKYFSKFFWKDIYCQHGSIGQMITDNDLNIKRAFSELVKRVDILQVIISVYTYIIHRLMELQKEIISSKEKYRHVKRKLLNN
ncbi:hypothetical protein EV424DRAFT_1319734 [Suillus variegatus]|nr:hypothetical protein EV424DRAFT_1319734 [Suillus variegatus]